MAAYEARGGRQRREFQPDCPRRRVQEKTTERIICQYCGIREARAKL